MNKSYEKHVKENVDSEEEEEEEGEEEEYDEDDEEEKDDGTPVPTIIPKISSSKSKGIKRITPPRDDTPDVLADFCYDQTEKDDHSKLLKEKAFELKIPDSKTFYATPKYKNHVELDPIIGKFQSEPIQNYLLGAKCIFCRMIINPAPIVKCLECSYVNPYICIPCFRAGTEGGKHYRSHKYTLLDPKGPPIFNVIPGKRQFGIMEDVALLELLCETNQDNWDEKNLVFPDLTYEDALDRFEDLMMSDIGIHIRENDPLCALRRPISGEHAEKFRMNFTPDDVLELKNTLPAAKTKFSDILEIAETLEADNDISQNSTAIFKPQSPKPGPSHYRNLSMKAEGSEDEDELFQQVLDTVYQNALKGKTERIRLQKPIVPNDIPFNPYKFCAYVREKNKFEKQKHQEEMTKTKEASENKKKSKKSLKKKLREPKRVRLSESDDEEDEMMETLDFTDIETPKRNQQTKRKIFKNPFYDFEKKRIAHARYRRQLREADTHVKKFITSKLNSEGEEEENDDDSNVPEPPELTAKTRAHKRLDNLIETFHKNMGFQSEDDWGSDIDDQFANALDGFDRDYDEASRLHIRQVGNTINDKPIPPYKNQLIKQQLRNLNSKLFKKWKADFTITSHGVSKFEKVYPSTSEQISRDPTDGFYDIYEASYRPFTNQDGKEILTESDLDTVTYNQKRHDYDIENKNEAEFVLTSVTKRHEPIDFSNMVNMAKVNSYQRVLKERDAQSSFAREYGLLPTFMDYTKKVTYPIGHTPDIDAQFEEAGLTELKDKYRPLLRPIRQVVTKPMFNEYLHNLLRTFKP
jgi:hypothetical protein